jgi:hypothetical protein
VLLEQDEQAAILSLDQEQGHRSMHTALGDMPKVAQALMQ